MSDVRPWHLPTYRKSAQLSEDGVYRYSLERWWDDARPDSLAVIGLNPSTADANVDDPTIRRCVDFADQLGFGGLVMLNVYAFRATDPKVMLGATARDTIGPDNDRILMSYLAAMPWAVCAWTDHVSIARRDDLLAMFTGVGCEPRVFGLTKNGAPRHPLYLPRGAVPVRWER